MKVYVIVFILFIACNNDHANNTQNVEIDTNYTNNTQKDAVASDQIKKDSIYVTKNKTIYNKQVFLSICQGQVNIFYQYMKAKQWQNAIQLLHKDGLNVSPVSNWISMFQKVQNNLGDFFTYQLYAENARFNIKESNGLGHYAELIYDTKYETKPCREKFTFFAKDDENPKILAYEYSDYTDDIQFTDSFNSDNPIRLKTKTEILPSLPPQR